MSPTFLPKLTYKRVGLLVATIVFGFAAVVINLQPHGWVSWYRLATEGRKADATITGRQMETHQTCEFEYIVAAVKYHGTDQGCRVEVGGRVSVTYQPTDPSFATTASPSRELIALILGPLTLALVGGTLSAWSVRRRLAHAS